MVERAVAFPIDDEILGERLGALVVPAESTEPTERELRIFIADRLLDYMVPEKIVISNTVPLTAVGKLSRKSLSSQLGIKICAPPPLASVKAGTAASSIEKTLLKIVRDLLQQSEIGLSDDFMSMGGDSFAATALLVEIEEKFDVFLTPGEFLENSSAEGLARLIEQARENETPPEIITIQEGDGTSPLFFTHGHEGHAFYSRSFAHYLGPARTIYALQYTKQEPMPCMEDYAAHFAQVMRTIYSQGPYLIAGHSFGAQLAFALAQQLVAAGEEVAFLGLLDDEADLFKRKFGVVERSAPASFTFAKCKRMLDCYTPSIYPGDIDLFVAETPPLERLADPNMGWSDITCGKVSCFDVQGSHTSMMSEKNIEHWGGLFAERLETAITTWPDRKKSWEKRISVMTGLRASPGVTL